MRLRASGRLSPWMSLAEPIDEARGSYEFPTRSLSLLTFQAMKQAGEL